MLIGSVRHSIDAKGRYIVPAKFRNDLGKQFVITWGIDGCLFVFTMERWEEVAAEIAKRPALDDDTLRFKRDFFGSAYDLETDSQFRVVIPPELRQRAGLDKDIVTKGMSNYLEIWPADLLEEYSNEKPVPRESKVEVLSGVIL